MKAIVRWGGRVVSSAAGAVLRPLSVASRPFKPVIGFRASGLSPALGLSAAAVRAPVAFADICGRSSRPLLCTKFGGSRNFHQGVASLTAFPLRGTDDMMMISLGNLADNPGARKKKKRVGRGVGSGRGKTCGRGHKGQRSRSGNHGLLTFEGGQTPAQRRYPKRGFTNKHPYISEFVPVSLNRLMYFVDTGRLDTSQMITMKNLRDCGVIKNPQTGVKLLAGDIKQIRKPIQIEVSDYSAKAKDLIEKAGGTVKKGYYNRLGMRALLKPEKFEVIPRRAAPPPRLLWKYPEHYKDVEAQLAARAKSD